MPCFSWKEAENSKIQLKDVNMIQVQIATLAIAQAFNLAFDRWKERWKQNDRLNSVDVDVELKIQ